MGKGKYLKMEGEVLRKVLFFCVLFLISISSVPSAGERDVTGSRDHPVLSRYPGSYITHYSQRKFDEYFLLLGPVRSGSDRDIQSAKTRKLEGKITNITYQCPKDRSTLEVYKNYELALKRAGFKVLYIRREK